MDEHRTLDEFLDPETEASESDQSSAPESDRSSASETDPTDVSDTVQPTAGTYRWTPDGAECADCGTIVERRWRDEAEFVCRDCKEW